MLDIDNLTVSFVQYQRGLRQRTMTALSHLSLSIEKGEIMALAGSSGSGKSLLAHAILGILPENASMAGKIFFKGEELTPKLQRRLRGRDIALIPQSVTSLNPLMRVGKQVRASSHNGNGKTMQKSLFKRFGLGKSEERLFPFQLSGGMARRVLVSSALAGNAGVIIADEPTPGLHQSVVRETLNYLRALADNGCAVLLITHDVGTAVAVADKIAVLYAGSVVEISPSSDFNGDGGSLRHPYTRAIWQALPENEFAPIDGLQPLSDQLPKGCLFGPRCSIRSSRCLSELPSLSDVRGGKVRCYHAS